MSRMLRAWFLVFAAVVFVHLGGVANLAQQRDSDPELPENKIPENAKAIPPTISSSGMETLSSNGEDVKVVQELLRHGSAKITMDVYTQAVTKAKRTAQNRVMACLRTREGGLVEKLCPQSVPALELANDVKLLKRFGVPDGI